jgi:hypothetical protein
MLLVWHVPVQRHDYRNEAVIIPRPVQQLEFDDEDLLLLWWALNEQETII